MPITMTDEERQYLVDNGHNEECIEFWNDVMVMEAIGERWDHWTLPQCSACEERRHHD